MNADSCYLRKRAPGAHRLKARLGTASTKEVQKVKHKKNQEVGNCLSLGHPGQGKAVAGPASASAQ